MKPIEATNAIASLADQLKSAKTALKMAEDLLDLEKSEEVKKAIQSILDSARALFQSISNDSDIPDVRCESIIIAASRGAAPVTLKKIGEANRLARKKGIVLPPHRYESLSRGSGWCRKGCGKDAVWGTRTPEGYFVDTPGTWTVGASDGYNRKATETWKVEFVQVGDETWTIAN